MQNKPTIHSKPGRGVTLSISIVLYRNDLELVERTLTCLETAVNHAVASGEVRAAILDVVDNASPGDYGERAGAQVTAREEDCVCPVLDIGFRAADRNRGYGAGHNLALAAVGSDVHLVLNPDVELEEDALSVALEYMRRQAATVLLAPAARGPAGDVEYLCKRYPSLLVLLLRASGMTWLKRRFLERLAHYELRELAGATEPAEVPLVSGCCMLARTETLKSIGGFDERYFLYFEDFDLSLRLGRRGRVMFHPGVHILHHGGYASRKGLRHVGLFVRGGLRFFRQYGWRWW